MTIILEIHESLDLAKDKEVERTRTRKLKGKSGNKEENL